MVVHETVASTVRPRPTEILAGASLYSFATRTGRGWTKWSDVWQHTDSSLANHLFFTFHLQHQGIIGDVKISLGRVQTFILFLLPPQAGEFRCPRQQSCDHSTNDGSVCLKTNNLHCLFGKYCLQGLSRDFGAGIPLLRRPRDGTRPLSRPQNRYRMGTVSHHQKRPDGTGTNGD